MKIKTKSFKKPEQKLIVRVQERHLWKYFHPHHYMTAYQDPSKSLPSGAKFFTFYWLHDNQEILVGCLGVVFQISKKQPAKRLTRIVVLPEYQGLGFSSKMINAVSRYYYSKGYMMYCSSFHPRLGEYWKSSEQWVPGMYNQQEFKKTDMYNDKSVSGLRDGVKMYRYHYQPIKNYNLLIDVLDLDEIKKEIKNLKDINRTPEDEERYKKAIRLMKKIKPVNTKNLNLLKNEDNIAYIPQGKHIKKPVLSPEERKMIRKAKKLEKMKNRGK